MAAVGKKGPRSLENSDFREGYHKYPTKALSSTGQGGAKGGKQIEVGGSDERHKSSVGRVSERTDQEKRTKATPDGARGDRRGVGAAARPTHHTTAERPQVKSRTVKAVSTKDVLGKPTGDELAMLKARIRQLEGERDSLQEKLDIMEKRISSGASVEKDNIRLQVQLNDATKDLEKTRKKLDEANEASKKAISEKSVLQSRHNTLLVEMEKLQISVERTEDEKTVLQGEKNNLINKNKRLQKEIDASLEDADRLSEENTNLVAENKRLRNRLNDLLHGLRDVKRSVVRVKEENGLLHDEIVSNGAEMMAIMKKCFGGLEMVVSQMDKQETTGNKHGGGIPSNDRLDNENQKLRKELADRVDQNEILLKQVKELEKVRDEQMDDLEDQYKEIEHLKEINEELNNRNVELSKADNVSFSRTDEEVEGCPGCAKLRLELNALQEEYESQKIKIEELEVRIEDLKEENDDYQQETKYLKQVLSYREDMKSVQVSQKATRQLQKLESNLEDAEKKCKDLEDEVSKLYSQKQTLLMNILKQHEEEVEGQDNAGDEDGEEEDDENEEDENEEDASEEEQPNVTSSFSFRTPKSRGGTIFGKRSYSMESEFSSGGTSFYDSSSDEENDAPSELNNAPQKLKDYVYVLQDDLKHFKSSFKETRAEKKSMERRLENSSEDFKAMLQRMQKLDKENVQIRDKMRKEKKTYKSQVKSFEQRIEELKENLQETEEEKQALIRCMQMNGGGPELETPVKKEPESPIPMDDMSRLIAKAQEFARQEQASRGKVSDKSSSEESEDNDVEEGEEEPPMKESAGEEQVSDKGSSSGSSSSSEDEEDGRPPVNNEMNRSWMQPEPKAPVSVLKNRMAHIQETRASPEDESTKDVIKEDEEEEESDDDIIVKPPPHARFLQRKASIASINMDRVSREKQHLEDEVASLSKYLNRSISRRRHSTVEMPKTPPLGAMKTLQSLLQKSDAELKESNAKIARLQEINADFEERFKDSETLQDDLRKAVVIANNFAMEEREKNNVLEEEKEELLKQLEALKKENARLKGRKSKGKNFKSRITGDEDLADSDNGDQGLEFCSSRHSSIASITSNVSRGSLDSGGRQDSNSNLCSSTVNGD
ncbi:predicted protein [Nematostella vectensis]|uniref:Uncharacterized protein n=1 Tax=Nematostella vectensis TaxID=45351 RepID=A7S2Y5_NEMVE|nr:predicted protein [Nematostella vectensis]|eukprot:XP_001633924.1 predicted protein [Nematostella vectensis]